MNKLALGAALAAALTATGCGQLAPKTAADPAAVQHPSAEADDVIAFWQAAGPTLWFAKDTDFDRRFRQRFLATHEAAARGELAHWMRNANGTLALVILLDQFPRNSFRDTPRMYATDEVARVTADAAFAAGHDREIPAELRVFLVLPFGHSESLADQDRAVELSRAIGPAELAHAEHHREIVRRFGRFPHRNPILGRTMTPEEQRYLDEGGYAG